MKKTEREKEGEGVCSVAETQKAALLEGAERAAYHLQLSLASSAKRGYVNAVH